MGIKSSSKEWKLRTFITERLSAGLNSDYQTFDAGIVLNETKLTKLEPKKESNSFPSYNRFQNVCTI